MSQNLLQRSIQIENELGDLIETRSLLRTVRISKVKVSVIAALLGSLRELNTRTEQERDQHKQDATRFEQKAEQQDADIQSLKAERDELRGHVKRLQSALSSVLREANAALRTA